MLLCMLIISVISLSNVTVEKEEREGKQKATKEAVESGKEAKDRMLSRDCIRSGFHTQET